VHAADASKPPPMQLAGGAANVVFVAGANEKRSKREMKTSAEWHGQRCLLCCVIAAISTINDLLRHPSTPPSHWFIVFKHNSCVHAAYTSNLPPIQLAGGTTNVVFVAGVNTKQSKREMKTSAEWHGQHC